MTEDQNKHSLLLPALEEAWGRYSQRRRRRADTQDLLADIVEWLLDISPVAMIVGASALAFGTAAYVVQADSGIELQAFINLAVATTLIATVLVIAPAPIAAAILVLQAVDAASLHAVSLRARDKVLSEPSLPLQDAAWAVRTTHGHLMRRSPWISRARRAPSYERTKQKVARDVAARYADAARPGGKLHDLYMLPPAASQRIIAGWAGDTETFLEAAAQLEDHAWDAALKIASRLPAGFRAAEQRESGNTAGERWFATLLATMGAAEPDEHQVEAALKLAETWEGTADGLILAAATL